MATQNPKNKSADDQNPGLSTKQTLGALGGIVVLLVLLFVGVSQTKEPGAELITDAAQPEKAEYLDEASSLNYEDAMLQEYETGALIELEGSIHQIFDEAIKGEGNMLLNIKAKDDNGVETTKVKQVMLTYVDEVPNIDELQDVSVYGRYIGTLEFESAVGASREVPAIQVDYIDVKS